MPAAAKGASAASAKAFAKYYVDLINYAMRTGKTGPVRKFAEKSCSTCAVISKEIDRVYRKSGHIERGRWRVANAALLQANSPATTLVRLQVQLSRQVVYSSPSASPSSSAPRKGRIDLYVHPAHGSWMVQQLDAF
jgi:hypothetical protein